MSYRYKLFFGAVLAVIAFACKKDTTTFFANGSAPVLTASSTTVSPKSTDSASTVLTLSWTNPKYSTDSSTVKYVLEIDSTSSFATEMTWTLSGSLSASFTGRGIDSIFAKFGFATGTSQSIYARVTSSYANNNEMYMSKPLTITVTPYVVPITLTPSSSDALKLALASASSTAVSFGWTASQYGADTFNYVLQFDTVGGNFANPQTFQYGTSLTGSFTGGNLNTLAIALGIPVGGSNNLEFRVLGYLTSNSVTPVVTSNVITINVTTYQGYPYVYVAGDYQGWSPSTAPALAYGTPYNSAFEGYIYVPAGGTYQFKLTSAPDWNHIAYGDGGSGTLSASGGNLTWPGAGGYYRVNADTVGLTWNAEVVTWGVIGSFDGWSNDVAMTYNTATQKWWAVIPFKGADLFKFRANADWNNPVHNFGIDDNGNLSYNAGNISGPAAAATDTVFLDLHVPGSYSYSIKQ